MALVVASVIPDGQGGRLVTVACDNEKDNVFRETVQAARSIEDFSQRDKTSLQRGGGRCPVDFPGDLVRWIRFAESARSFQENEWLDFDVVTAITGPWCGLRVVGIGSNKLKRQRAAEVALVVAITLFYQQCVAAKDVKPLLDRIHLIPFDQQPAEEPNASTVEQLALTDAPRALTNRSSEPEPGEKRRRNLNKILHQEEEQYDV